MQSICRGLDLFLRNGPFEYKVEWLSNFRTEMVEPDPGHELMPCIALGKDISQVGNFFPGYSYLNRLITCFISTTIPTDQRLVFILVVELGIEGLGRQKQTCVDA